MSDTPLKLKFRDRTIRKIHEESQCTVNIDVFLRFKKNDSAIMAYISHIFADIFFCMHHNEKNCFFQNVKLYFIFGVKKDFVYDEPIKKYRLRKKNPPLKFFSFFLVFSFFKGFFNLFQFF